MIHELRMLLLNFGIISTFKIGYNKKYKRNYYGVKITDIDFYGKFLNEIGFITERKQKSNIIKPEGSTNRNIIPTISELVDRIWKVYKQNHQEVRKRRAKINWMSINTLRQVRYGVRGFSYKKLKQFLSGTNEFSYLEEWQYLKYLSEQNIYWDFVQKIEHSENETYDLHIPQQHNFFSNGFISHNSGQAKSQSADRIMTHYGLGHRISGEGARRTGLAYTWHQTGNRWAVSFGTIPRNDKRLVFIDEASGIDSEELSKLTDMRSEGIADATNGPIPAKTRSRTRLIWMSNTKSGHPLSEYPYPVKAITEVFKRSEDIRRFDFAIAVKSGDITEDVVHQLISSKEKMEHRYTSLLCNNLLLWSWTRKADQVYIPEETEKEILEASKAMSKKYSSLIPLVEPSDQRNKIARLSVAVACRLFSTKKENPEIVQVDKEHVEFVKWYLESQYDSHSLDYLNFSKTQKTSLLEEEYINANKEILNIHDNYVLAETLVKTPVFGKNILEEILGYDREETKRILKIFYMHNLIKMAGKNFKLSAAGVSFFKRFVESNKDLPKDNSTILNKDIIIGNNEDIGITNENDDGSNMIGDDLDDIFKE